MTDNNQRTLVTIITESILENNVAKDLEILGANGYTIFDVRGKGRHGRRTADWRETANIQFNIVCKTEAAEKIVQHMKEKYMEDYGMTIYFHYVQILRSEKF